MVELNFFVNPAEVLGNIWVTQGSFLTGTTDSHASGLDAASIDLGLTAGTDIYTFANGRVVGANSNYTDSAFPAAPTTGPATFGNYVTIEYSLPSLNAPFYVTYAHLSQITADYWVNQLISTGGPVNVSSEKRIGEVAGALETPYPIHLHMSFATSYGNYGFPNGIAEAWNNDANSSLLSQLSIGGQSLSALADNDYILSTPLGSEVFPVDGVAETISLGDAADEFGVSDGSGVANLYLKSIFGSAISNVTYKGSASAAFLVSDFEILGAGIDFQGGILLSSGGFPASSNTSSGFSVSHGTPGDADLNDVASAAYSGAGTTYDAAVLEFDIFIDDPDVDGMRFDIVFGSDEYPEFSNTSVIDVAAVFVNGENKALFNGDPDTPLSVIDKNLALNFVDNQSSAFPIEWDGFGALSVRPALKQGLNTIKIAVADTGDSIFDSAIYATNFELLREGATGGEIFKVLKGLVGHNDLEPTEAKEEVIMAVGPGSVSGTLKELSGDVITGFTDQIKLIIEQVNLLKEWVKVTFGSAILDIDENGDGVTDGTITLEGDFEGAEFSVNAVGGDTVITANLPSENSPPSAVDDIFGVDEDQMFTGNVLADNGNGADSDPDGDVIQVSLISGPAEGILIVNSDGSFSYVADSDVFDLAAPGDVIEQSFTYQIDDGNGEVDQATAKIAVAILDDGETIAGGNGREMLSGTDGGEDLLLGMNGSDELYGLDGADTLDGGNGDDLLFGGEGPDFLFGQNGNDQLYGSAGNDTLNGGRGNDFLHGGMGDDFLTGGKGYDKFMFVLGDGTDTVLDFGVGEDLIGLEGVTFSDLSIGQAGDDAIISSNGDILAVLIGVPSTTLSEADFFLSA